MSKCTSCKAWPKKKSLIKNKQTLMIIQASQDINGNGSFYSHIKNDEQYTRPIYSIADLITKVAHLGVNCDIKANKLKVFICRYRKFWFESQQWGVPSHLTNTRRMETSPSPHPDPQGNLRGTLWNERISLKRLTNTL